MPREVSRVRNTLADLGLPATMLEDARLLSTELVTNSIRHSGVGPQDTIRIRVAWSGRRLRVDVYDRVNASAPPKGVAASIRPSPGAESGWGLYLIDRLASRWGSAAGRYWFELEDEPSSEATA